MQPKVAPLAIHLRRSSLSAAVPPKPRTTVAVPATLSRPRAFSDLRAPPPLLSEPQGQANQENKHSGNATNTVVKPTAYQLPQEKELELKVPPAMPGSRLIQRFFDGLGKDITAVVRAADHNFRPGVQLVTAAAHAAQQYVNLAKPTLANPADVAADTSYKTLDKLHPGLVHEQTLGKAGERAPQFHVTPDQFKELSKVNPIVGWISQNARFHSAGQCYGEAFAEVRRLAGVPLEMSRADKAFESFYPVPTDFIQVHPDNLESVLSEAGVVVFTGAGQLVAGDSYQRLVESGNYTRDQMLGGGGGSAHWAEGRVNHSVVLIDDKSGLIPNGHVIVYDMDPYCKRYAHLHEPNPALGKVSSPMPDPYFVPEADRHNVLRVAPLAGLLDETSQFGLMPKVMRYRGQESQALGGSGSGPSLIGE